MIDFKVGQQYRVLVSECTMFNKIATVREVYGPGEASFLCDDGDSCGVHDDAISSYQLVKDVNNMKYEVGDLLVDNYSNTFLVEGIVGKVYIGIDDCGQAEVRTEQELEEYKPKTDPVEMTVAEIAEKLGHDVKVVKD